MNQQKTETTQAQPGTVLARHIRALSIANQLRFGLPVFILLSLLLTGGGLIWVSYQTQRDQLKVVQEERSRAVAAEINAYLDDLQAKLGYLARMRGLTDLSPEIQHDVLEALTRHNSAYEAVAILDSTGQVVATVSAYGEQISGNLANTSLFLRTFKQKEDFIAPVEIDPETQLLVATLAVPVRNQEDEVSGVLMAKVNLEFLSRIISRVQVGATGYAYVLDNRNFLIAEEGSSADTLRDISAAPFIQDLVSGRIDSLDTYQGLKGQEVLGAMASVRTGRWNVVVELPVAEAFAPVRNMLVIMGAALAVTVVVAVGLGIFSAQRIVVPLQRLTEAATHISAGQFTRVAIANQDELGLLAGTFNVMADQLEGLYATLEQQVASRTQRLELIAALGERLSAILSLEELLPEIVNQVKLSFDYYHVHIYLLDQAGKNLTVVAGIGEAGAKMINRHSIPLNAPTSLVARAARTGQVVRVDNVREAEDWLPNPLLPDTYSEMAVPIVLGKEEQVVGVLDVQEDKIAGLDEEDADLLQTLANQVAVAIRNARLFNQVQSALAEVQAVQERYIERSWEKAKMMARGGQFHYARNDAPALAEAAVQEARQQAVAQEGPAIIAIPRSADPAVALEVDQPAPAALVAPITLRDKVIGVLQLHAGDNIHSWSEDDLLVIEAVVDQLAQTAETLRLFEDTRLQASYESLLIQITNKLRRAPTLDLLAKVVAEELGQALGVSHSSVQLGTVTGSFPLPEKPANGHNSSN